MFKIKFFLVSLVLMLLASCGNIGKGILATGVIKKPDVKIESVAVTNLSFTQLDLGLILSIENPNKFSFTVDSIDYSIKVYQKPLIVASQQDIYKVEAGEKKIVNIPVSLRMKDLRQVLRRFKLSEVPYNVEGKIGISVAKMKSISVPISKSGNLNLLEKFGL